MKGLELAREYYNLCRPMLLERIPDIMANAAAGLAGEGSECFGCDDDASRDHDFGPGFCLWLDDETLYAEKARIDAAFAALPAEFAGMPTRRSMPGRVGPVGIKAYYKFFTGLETPPQTWREWLGLPEVRVAAAVNGEVFEDASGRFSGWRAALLDFYPQDVLLKKIAARAMNMAQAGQYNLPRSLKRGEAAAAMLACAKFAEAALSFVFLVNKRYMPFYKWAPRLAKNLPALGGELASLMDNLAGHPLRGPQDMGAAEMVEDFCVACAAHLRAAGLSEEPDSWLWAHGPNIIAHVDNREIRGMNLLEA